ncbi:MAG: PQQ-binding-like beta-propeller repeat protein [Salinivirgaceae bacterium]|nr:PQQ-binding-like beta-propeller repeat protein [Salinivirgaceae bacterium]
MRTILTTILTLFGLTAMAGDDATVVKIDGKFYSTPIVTAEGNLVIASHNKTVYLFDSKGRLKNSFTAKGWFHATPRQLTDGQIAIGCYDRYFYFLDKDGNFVSRIKPGGKIFTEPVELGSVIAFGTSRGRVAFYNRLTDSLYYARVRGKIIHGSPLALSDNSVAIGGNGKRLCIIGADANLKAQLKTKGWIMHSKPAKTFDHQVVIGTYGKRLYSVDTLGRELWQRKVGGRIHSSILQTPDSNIVFGAFDSYIYCFDSRGQLIERQPTGKKVVSSPAMVNDTVFAIAGIDKSIYLLTTRGRLLGSIKCEGSFFSTPIVMPDGTLFCCTMKGTLYFIDKKAVDDIATGRRPVVEIESRRYDYKY